MDKTTKKLNDNTLEVTLTDKKLVHREQLETEVTKVTAYLNDLKADLAKLNEKT